MTKPQNNQQSIQNALEKVLMENIVEKRRGRRWGIFFKSLFALFFLLLLAILIVPAMALTSKRNRAHTSVVDISGTIMPGGANSADNVVSGLEKAFKDKHTVGIILRINSPGGSPVQASYVYNSIIRLRLKYPKKKIYAVCSDMCTSAAYYIASSANDIYANPSSLVGSIGVLMNSFGFTGIMNKLGIQRRLITAGVNKGFLDPFSPMKPQEDAYAHKLIKIVHQVFIHDVKKGRGKRLKNNPELFTGMIWTGLQAKPLGLIDGFGSAGFVARNIIKNNRFVNYTKKSSFFKRFSKGIGANVASGVLSSLSSVSHLS